MFFILSFSCFVSHMSKFDALLANRGHFEHKHLKKSNSKMDLTLMFVNDLELCACLVWVT